MQRRTLLTLAPAATLAGCAGFAPKQPEPDPVLTAEVVHDIKLAATALEGMLILAALARPLHGKVKVVIIAKIGAALIHLKNAAADIAPGMAVAIAQPHLRTIETALDQILAAIADLDLPPKAALMVAAARRLLPLVELATDLHDAVATKEQARELLKAGI